MATRAHPGSNATRQGAAAAAAEEEDVDVDTIVEMQAAGPYGHAGYAPAPAAPPPVEAPPPKTARSRPTNNQLLYKAYFRWSHYQFKLQPGLVLPEETEACASVTSAFLQVLNTLFFVETRRIENPRNILQLLSMNTRRTKVVELSSGTHRVPDELKRHSLSDGGTGSYSTNLDRNRYGNDDQYLSTVIRYDLEFLDLCPCMVDVEIIDAKNGQGSILVSADPEMCNCGTAGAGGIGAALAPAGHQAVRHVQHASPQLPQPVPRGAASPAVLPAAARSAQKAASAGGGGDAAINAAPVPAGAHPTASKNSGSELFDALLIAATGGGDDAGGATSKQAAAAPPPGIPRARSRLWHTGASGEGDSLQNAVEAFKACENEEIASGQPSWEGGRGSPVPLPAPGSKGKRIPRRSSLSNMAGLSSPMADDGVASLPPVAPLSTARAGGLPTGLPTGGEQSGENGPRQEAEQPSVAGDAAHGGGAFGGVVHAGSAANLARLGRDQDLRRLQDDFRGLKEDARALEGQLQTMKAREEAAVSAVTQAREDADAQRQAVSALRAEVARLTAAKEAAEREAAAVKTQVQAQGGSVATPPPEGPTAPVSPQAGGDSAAAAAELLPMQPVANGSADLAPAKRKPEEAAADEPASKRLAAADAVQPAPTTPTAPEPTPAAG